MYAIALAKSHGPLHLDITHTGPNINTEAYLVAQLPTQNAGLEGC